MDQPQSVTNLPNAQQNLSYRIYNSLEDTTDYTVTFVVGFCVLTAFLILGVVASAYLCVTLKKGTLLWVTESNRQLNRDKPEEPGQNKEENSKSLKEVKINTNSQATTQI